MLVSISGTIFFNTLLPDTNFPYNVQGEKYTISERFTRAFFPLKNMSAWNRAFTNLSPAHTKKGMRRTNGWRWTAVQKIGAQWSINAPNTTTSMIFFSNVIMCRNSIHNRGDVAIFLFRLLCDIFSQKSYPHVLKNEKCSMGGVHLTEKTKLEHRGMIF